MKTSKIVIVSMLSMPGIFLFFLTSGALACTSFISQAGEPLQ
jgi:hypothetical protein